MFGLLNLNKAPGVTSRDVVNRVQQIVRPLKVGHAGTLDPLATGVLVVAIGPATRLVEYVQRMPKTYRATFLLGRTSDTEDVEGTVRELAGAAPPTEESIREALPRFVGQIEQVPPAYSALKVRGERAHELARRGESVELAPRIVQVYSLELVSYAYPRLTLRVLCGGGTYVRSLGRDLARSLGTEAVMLALVREAIGPFTIAQTIAADSLTLPAIQAHLLPPLLALCDLPRLVVTPAEEQRLGQGRPIANRWSIATGQSVAVNDQGTLVAIVVPVSPSALRATKCFIGARL